MLRVFVSSVLILVSCRDTEKPEGPKGLELHIACIRRPDCDRIFSTFSKQGCELIREQTDATGRITQVYFCRRPNNAAQ